MTIHELNERFGLDGAIEFAEGAGGLPKATLTSSGGTAEMMLHGAHVTHFQPTGGEAVLWMSRKSWFEPGKPIRGGVPICWPWFGPNGPRKDSPNHGFARLFEWAVESTGKDAEGNPTITLLLTDSERSREYWPGRFELRYVVTVGNELRLRLETLNVGDEAMTITEALHSYLAVSDVRKISIRGLENTEYYARIEGPGRFRQSNQPITFAGEIDRCYQDTEATCVLDDPVMARTIVVAKSGSQSTVVWNPWVEKSLVMPDYGNDEWREMVCIETANNHDNAVSIPPGETHAIEARIAVR